MGYIVAVCWGVLGAGAVLLGADYLRHRKLLLAIDKAVRTGELTRIVMSQAVAHQQQMAKQAEPSK